ncbi:UBX domain-containing protein 8 [Trichomycterus rosablanca]|uniref:UBX domain-containing protein 8 n=1 Tax=Trichomycterus rosablanca TaxID=2290929 RepID=UPI002F35EF83
MAAKKDFLFVGVLFFFVFCIFSWKYSIIGVKDAVTLAGRALLILAVFTWMSSWLFPKIKSYLFPASPATLEGPVEDANALSALKQTKARIEQQHHHTVKSDAYNEAVLKPRQEAVLRRKQEDFYRMTGQSWKLSQGFTLGGEGDLEENPEKNETPNQEAAKKRKELEMPHRASVQTELPKEKKIIVLPDEPSENEDGVVKIALRCPSGKIIRRRFFKTCSSTVLLDWLHKSGYSPILYSLYTSYPRRPLLMQKDLSITEAGITAHTTLNVEEKDPSNT